MYLHTYMKEKVRKLLKIGHLQYVDSWKDQLTGEKFFCGYYSWNVMALVKSSLGNPKQTLKCTQIWQESYLFIFHEYCHDGGCQKKSLELKRFWISALHIMYVYFLYCVLIAALVHVVELSLCCQILLWTCPTKSLLNWVKTLLEFHISHF